MNIPLTFPVAFRPEIPADRPAAEPLSRLLVHKRQRWLVIRLDEVDWIEGAGNYVRLHVGAEAHLHRLTLAGLEARLDRRKFARIHRSTIVNLDRVVELRGTGTGHCEVLLRGGARLSMSRRYRRRVLERTLGS